MYTPLSVAVKLRRGDVLSLFLRVLRVAFLFFSFRLPSSIRSYISLLSTTSWCIYIQLSLTHRIFKTSVRNGPYDAQRRGQKSYLQKGFNPKEQQDNSFPTSLERDPNEAVFIAVIIFDRLKKCLSVRDNKHAMKCIVRGMLAVKFLPAY